MNSSTARPPRRHRRGFTLIELIVTLLVLGILATIAVVAYGGVTDRATTTAAQASLKQFATSILAHTTVNRDPDLDRTELVAVLNDQSSVDVVDGVGAGAQWTLVGSDTVPASGQIAVGFDTGAGTQVDVHGGTRVALMMSAAGKVFSEVVDITGAVASPVVEESSAKTPAAVLADGAAAPALPSAPAPVGSVTVGALTYTTATLSWAAVPGATSYVVTNVTAGTSQTVAGTSAGVTGVSETSAQFTVAAVNAGGTGAPSEAVTVAFPAVPSLAALTYNTSAPGCADTTIVLPAGGAVTGTVTWGDGASQAMTANASHTYATAGTYQVRIDGTFSTFGAMSGTLAYSDAPCIVSVDTWQNTDTTSLAYAFATAKNLVAVPDVMDTNGVTTMQAMFSNADAFNDVLTFTDTSKVTSLASMFSGADAFNQPFTFDGPNLTNLSNMFQSAVAFNQPLKLTRTSKVTTMAGMFFYASAFNQPVELDTASATTYVNMFKFASALNSPVNFTDTSKASTMAYMFQGATAFNQPLNFNTGNVTSMSSMLAAASSFNQDLSGWDTKSVTSHADFDTGTTAWVLPRPTFAS